MQGHPELTLTYIADWNSPHYRNGESAQICIKIRLVHSADAWSGHVTPQTLTLVQSFFLVVFQSFPLKGFEPIQVDSMGCVHIKFVINPRSDEL